ncbi:MAG: hypothetical protein AB7G93_17120 [Bdellovibrionales bacterium]
MIYSGADLVRASGQQQERMERLNVTQPVRPVNPAESPAMFLNEDTHSALLRFARFIKNQKKEKARARGRPSPSETKRAGALGPHPYHRHQEWLQHHEDRGRILDLFG